MGHSSEVGVTNLGPVPAGMSFIDATFAARSQRKYRINPRHSSGRLTACETCREIWRSAETLPDPARVQMQELAAQVFDMAKRMNARMAELREMVEALGGNP